MAQPIELKISLRRGISGAGETTEAEVCLSFKLGKSDSDLGSLVEAKFHEVKGALIQALESEEPCGPENSTDSSTADEDDLTDWTMAAPAPNALATGAMAIVLDEGLTETKDLPVRAEAIESDPSQLSDGSAPVPTTLSEDRLLITPAQKRTIQSLCASAGIDGRQLQGMLESGYNRTNIESLGRREAGSLIFRLSQRHRENMLRGKPDYGSASLHQRQSQEVQSQNGVSH